jgi:hypothetical protein
MDKTPRDPLRGEFEFPKDGILWRSYEDTIALLNEKTRPVLAFVMDQDATCWPFLREIFKEIPKNKKLRDLLNGSCIAMLLKIDVMPKDMAEMGAGSAYHIAILAPTGLNPMTIFNHVTGKPEALVEQIAKALEVMAPFWN